MIGDMIAKVRTEKGLSKTELARLTNINIGHLTHIEKGERNPSHKTLKSICKALGIPYQQLMYTYDKSINEDQAVYNVVEHISYNKILAVENLAGFIECPSSVPSSSIALKVHDDSMTPFLNVGEYAFIEYNCPLNNKDIGLFELNGDIIIRRFLTKKGNITLKSENKKNQDIAITKDDKLYIIGRVLIK